MRFRNTVAGLLAAAALASAGTASAGPTPTPEEYIAQADPICKQASKPTARQFRKANRFFRRDKFAKGIRATIKAFQIQLAVGKKIRRLEKPPEDRRQLGRWINAEQTGIRRQIQSYRAVRRGHEREFRRLQRSARRSDRKATRIIRGYGFRQCA